MNKICILLAAAAAGAVQAEAGEDELVEQSGKSAWHLRIGPVMAPRVRARIHMARPALPVLPNAGLTTGTGGAVAADPSAGFTDRTYADGYVKPDEGTEDPSSMISGLTWNWAAKDVGAQYAGGKMEFRTDQARWSENVSASSYAVGSGSERDSDILLGVEAMGGWTFLDNDALEAAVDAGFRFYGSGDLNARSRYGTSVTTTRSSYRYVDSYDASGWTDVPSGAHEGTPGGPGRVLGATPTRREELIGSESSTETRYYNSSAKLEYRIWDLRLGPTLGWKATDYLTIRGGVYGLLGLVDAELKTSAQTSDGSRRSNKSTCDAVFGLAAGLSAQLNLTDSLFLMGGIEYDWWADSVSLKADGGSARLKLSDYSVSLGVGIEF